MKWLLTIIMVLALSCSAWANGITVWGLSETDIGSDDLGLTGRIGYQRENLEFFIGSVWHPDFVVEEKGTQTVEKYDQLGKSPFYWKYYENEDYIYRARVPQVFTLGLLNHHGDIIDSESGFPIIPELLLSFIPEEFVATPYWGGQVSIGFLDADDSFYGGIVGLLIKTNPDSKVAFVAEGQYNENWGDFSIVPEEFRVNLGFRIYFD